LAHDFLPYGRQKLDDADIEAVVDVLRSSHLTTGPAVRAFEQALAKRVGAHYACAVTNGTSALHAACHAAGIGPGDEVIVPAISFAASANCVRYVGAEPVFVDVDPRSGLLDLNKVESAITHRCKAILPVHLTGQPADLEPIAHMAARHHLTVIEDAAHALGGIYHGHPIGDGAFSAFAIFSFHPVKHITTAEGGAVVTNDPTLHERLQRFRDHGLVRSAESFHHESHGPWYYEQQELGYNLRLSDVHCALGVSQLKKLEEFLERRRSLAARYDERLRSIPYVEPIGGGMEDAESAYHLYSVLIDFETIGVSRTQVMQWLRRQGIGTQVHYVPIPGHPYYQRRGWSLDDFPGASHYYQRELSLPLHPAMDASDVDRVVTHLEEAVDATPS